MERWACADVPSLALQILLEDHPDWRVLPVAVVDRDTAQGVILEVNRHARKVEIRPGMSYAAGLSLARDLRAGVVDAERVDECCSRLVDELHEFSPDVEPDPEQAGLFWLRATGLDRLFGGFDVWASGLYEHLCEALGIRVSITVGWTRFGTFAASRAESVGWRIFESSEHESEHARSVPVELLGLPSRVVEKLRHLAVETVGEFCALPSSGVRKRFGVEAAALWRFAHGGGEVPLQAVAWEEPVSVRHDLDEPMWDSTRLTFLLKSYLHPLLLELAGRHCDLRELTVTLSLEDGDERELSVRPSTPTLEEVRIVELIRLKLDRLSLPAAIVRLHIDALGVPYHREQSHLFRDNARRDLHVANHALARLQAEHGEESVSQIVLEDRHLPEGQFSLKPLEALKRPNPEPAERPTLVRRIFGRPQPLPRFDPDIGFGWLVRDLDEGVVMKSQGPHRLSGGWWTEGIAAARHIVSRRLLDSSDHHVSPRVRYLAREGLLDEAEGTPEGDHADDAMRAVAPHRGELYPGPSRRPNTSRQPPATSRQPPATSRQPPATSRQPPGVARDYWYVETDRGDIFWVFWDHQRRQWFLHGVVE